MPPSSVAPAANGTPLFSWLTERSAGVLLHPTSLPGDQGIGTFDGAVDRFLDFLQESGLKTWQICPLGPTGYGDSPYQCFSAFAGNPYLIDLHALVRHGLLTAESLTPLQRLNPDRVDFGALYTLKWPLLAKAYERFIKGRIALPYGEFELFKSQHAEWLLPYATFRAFKDHYDGKPWWEWPDETRTFATALKSTLRKTLAAKIDAHAFYQYLFFGQWTRVRAAAAKRSISIIGDLPIFVALDSADVWAAPHLFEIDEKTSRPTAVAGVPPDYFSTDGQLWGNPLYRWSLHARDGYAWWMQRLRAAFALHDVVRIDHFRAFDEYWSIPYPAATAKVGAWLPGPGLDFFRLVRASFPDARIIAEDLGDLTPTVVRLREQTGLPGMTILQFAFGGDSRNLYLPHNLTANSVVYPGTHDNDTTLGWYATASEKERDHVRRYLRVGGEALGWDFVRAGYQSVSRLAVFPLQDLLSLDSKARLNTPGKAEGNWQWRYRASQLDPLFGSTTAYLRSLGDLYGR
ncbi:MAG: 4-alpha-glucanotransferase [Opitutaceae bacterium]|nr:4-alpha-glucanotransferase [Opitutaceae bacterium]